MRGMYMHWEMLGGRNEEKEILNMVVLKFSLSSSMFKRQALKGFGIFRQREN